MTYRRLTIAEYSVNKLVTIDSFVYFSFQWNLATTNELRKRTTLKIHCKNRYTHRYTNI